MSTGIIEAARAQGRTLLNEVEAKQLLEQAGVPVSPARLARSKDEAAAMADEIGRSTRGTMCCVQIWSARSAISVKRVAIDSLGRSPQ